IWRWRRAFQHDFAARMSWCINGPDEANHNPAVVVNGTPGKDVVRIKARPGEAVTLSAKGTTDPDGDTLRYHWFAYPEAGTFRGKLEVANAHEPDATVTVRGPGQGTAHLI